MESEKEQLRSLWKERSDDMMVELRTVHKEVDSVDDFSKYTTAEAYIKENGITDLSIIEAVQAKYMLNKTVGGAIDSFNGTA